MSQIYIDGDACPVREEVYRVAGRLSLQVIVVSNGSRPIRPPGLDNVRMITVDDKADAADDWIAEKITQADICVSADIPLASRCLAKGARAIAPTGKVWTSDNIGHALAGREVARHLRELGAGGGGPAPFSKADRSKFLSALDTLVRAALREQRQSVPPQP
ncbi:MAG TPA: YaiI/YqxD family protein [Candidatus Polarisedimenticolia bacterium]|nr:YaiI/YqxD family protein [Dongiaceae bacterium]HYV89296.1 YaiI/YqxD family protein [Candidatus Polarisedimenticolia bacterium]